MNLHTIRSKRLSAWLLSLLLSLTPVWATAAEAASEASGAEGSETDGAGNGEAQGAEPPADGEAAAGDEAATGAEAATAGEGAGNAENAEADGEQGPEVFVPSEEISEDFAVSFPVDI